MMRSLQALYERARMLERVRLFFSERGVLEVDCPILSSSASVDAHIDLIETSHLISERKFLHSSPEYCMKRLLSEGISDIYQMSHVFRLGDKGTKHNPEFMMIEWYRKGFSLHDMVEDTINLIRLFLGDLPHNFISYKEAFMRYTGIDPYEATEDMLKQFLQNNEIHFFEENKDELLNLILGLFIEQELGKEELTVFAYYPPSQAALSKTRMHEGVEVAERFEVYYKGIELANGYNELQDPEEQYKRFCEANIQRKALGKSEYPIDKRFIEALQNGLPDCSGVAVGFDRLMMLRLNVATISEVLSFDWDHA